MFIGTKIAPSRVAAEIQIDEVDRVRQVDAEPIARGDAAGGQRARHARGARIDLAEGISAIGFERHAIALRDERQIEQL